MGVHTSGVRLAPNATISDDDSAQFSKLVVTLTNPLAATDNIKPSDNATSIATTAGLTFSSSTNDSVLTVNGVASSSTYEQLLQNLVFTSAVSSSSANSVADRSVTVILTDVDSLGSSNQASIKLNSDGSAGAGTQTITVKMQKTPPAFVKADGNKLLELTGDFGSNEAIKISLPGDSVSTPQR